MGTKKLQVIDEQRVAILVDGPAYPQLMLYTLDGGKSWKPLGLNTRTRVVTISCDRRAAGCLVGGDRGLLLYGNPFRFHR